MTLAEWREVAEIVQAIFVTLAVVGGGLWTLLTFRIFRQKSRAELELRQLERAAREQAVVNLEMAARQLSLALDPGLYIQAEITARNDGTRNTLLAFQDEPLWVAEVFVQEDGANVVGGWGVSSLRGIEGVEEQELSERDDLGYRPAYVLRSGMTASFEFLASVPRPGVYYMDFSARVSSRELAESIEAGLDLEHVVWSAETFVVVYPINVDGEPVQRRVPLESDLVSVVSALETAAAATYQMLVSDEFSDEAHDALVAVLEDLKDLRVDVLTADDLSISAVASVIERLIVETPAEVLDTAGQVREPLEQALALLQMDLS